MYLNLRTLTSTVKPGVLQRWANQEKGVQLNPELIGTDRELNIASLNGIKF